MFRANFSFNALKIHVILHARPQVGTLTYFMIIRLWKVSD